MFSVEKEYIGKYNDMKEKYDKVSKDSFKY